MSVLLNLSWLPDNLPERILDASDISSVNEAGYLSRLAILKGLFHDLQNQLIVDGIYTKDILNEAFIRSHDEPGRAWNMDEWNTQHKNRLASRRTELGAT